MSTNSNFHSKHDPEENNADDLNDLPAHIPERPTSAPAVLDIPQENIFTSFLPNSGYGSIFSEMGNQYQRYPNSNYPEDTMNHPNAMGFNSFNEPPMKPPPGGSLWERFSKISLSSEDLGLEDHLLPDLSSDPDINHEGVPIITDDELLKASPMRPVDQQNRFLWNQRALDDRNPNSFRNPGDSFSPYHGYPTERDLHHSPINQLLTGGAPQINSQLSRNDFGAPGTFPSMGLRNPISNRNQIHSPFPNYSNYPPNGNEMGGPMDPMNHLNHSMNQQTHNNMLLNPTINHQRTKSTDSYISQNLNFFHPTFPSSSSTSNGATNQNQQSNHSLGYPDDHLGSDDSSVLTCRYYANGYCIRGDRCNFAHVPSDSMPQQQQPHSPHAQQPQQSQPPASNQSSSRQNGRRGRNVEPVIPVSPSKKQPVVDPKNSDDILSRFHSIDQVVGQVYRICKDQHGCRFLQKKLEEKDKNPRSVEIIFNEVYDHMVELMTDPFGNYLCQKLIEHCSEQQQLFIVQKVAPHLVNISKNMHGTRAVQKMIECLCTPSQVQLVVNALKSSVVPLIQDLNGNHVIQRCLHRLSYKDKQFVYDAVASNCVEVATHRHGCCVMQRCIDYASEEQKLQLVREISRNVLVLVQDPFGNYVVQYVLELPFSIVKVNLIQQFLTHLVNLSTQKFSSNVIEKCLHVADEKVKIQLIDELMQPATLERLLQDPFGNYVIQTALTESRPNQKAKLTDEIRPLLPALRNTPYAKRIQNKIARDEEP